MKSLRAMLLRIIEFLNAVICWIIKVVDVILLAFFKVGVTIMHQLAKFIKGTPSIVFGLVGAILPFMIFVSLAGMDFRRLEYHLSISAFDYVSTFNRNLR